MTRIDEDTLDELEAGPDLDTIAKNIIAAKRRLKKATPSAVDFATAVSGLSISDTMIGSSTLTVTIDDDDFVLLDSGFFDSDKDGRIDPIDLRYPEGSRLWWRLTQCNPRSNGTIEMVFMERAAVHMMSHLGPLKVSRAKRTRAQFLKTLTSSVKVAPIKFVSKDLNVKQPIGSAKDRKAEETRKTEKGPGISTDEPLKIGSHTMTSGEINNAERALDVADSLSAPEKAALALAEACIVEAPNFANPSGGDASSVGILQLLSSHLGGSSSTDGGRRDIELVCKIFLEDGFWGKGGAIALANAHPDWSAGEIAQAVQGSAFPKRYDAVEDDAKAVIEAYGGGFTGSKYHKQYNFEVGTTDKPKENYWDAANRLADEVEWPFFLDGQNAYFDPETTLIKQKPVAVIRRADPSVISWQCDWDSRHIATELRMDLICEPFDFRAGEVFKLVGFGPASTGSTAKLPGRWLISEIERQRSSLYSSFTLKQPHAPEPEPLSELGTRATDPTAAGGDIEGSPKEIIDNVVLPIAREVGVPVTPSAVEVANARHGPTVSGGRSDHQGPPLVAWAADMSNGSAPTPEMDKLAQALSDKFDIPWSGSGLVSKSADGYRYQLIYRTNEGGNHFNHVHFGVKRTTALP